MSMEKDQVVENSGDAAADTRTRLLDVAEELFANQGISATSLRSITAAAGANLASIHYYFGSKEELIRQVFARRIGPLNVERLRMLSRFEADAPSGVPSTEQLVEAMVAPVLKMALAGEKQQRLFARLFGQIHADTAEIQKMMEGHFADVVSRFVPAFERALPHLPRRELVWRIKFMIGTMATSVLPMPGGGPFETLNLGAMRPDTVSKRLIPFLVAAMTAPVSREAGGSESG
jgi:AcrR family transcriptional regulator